MTRLALLALLLPVAVQAQTALTPGHPDLAAPTPQSFEHVTRVAGSTPRTTGWRHYSETRQGDRLVIVERRSRERGDTSPGDTTVVAWPSLAPLARSASGADEETTRLAVLDGRLRGRHVLGNLDETIDAALPADAFIEGSRTVLARSLPLRDGYTATLRFISAQGDLTTTTARVGAREAFTQPDGSETMARTVVLSEAGKPDVSYAVDEATRALLRTAYEFRPGVTTETLAPPMPPTVGVIRPGDPALDTSWMTGDDTATFALNLIEPMAMPVGTSTVTRTVAGGVVTSVQTIVVPSQGMNETQTATADLVTLRPLSQANPGQQAVALTFTDGLVSGTKAGAPLSVALDLPVFDSTWASEIAQSLPLATGYTATAAVYDASNGLSTVTFTVTGQEDVDGAPAWTVEAVSATGPTTYVIDAASRRMLRMRLSPQPGVVVEMARQP